MTGQLWFVAGLAGGALSLAGAVVAIVLLSRSKRRMQRLFDQEYGGKK